MIGDYSNYYESSNLLHGSLMQIMGTRLDALILGAGPTLASKVWEEVKDELVRLNKMLNKFDKESELYRVNNKAIHSPCFVSEELWKILADCEQYYERTYGYFDISLKDYSKVEFDNECHTVYFTDTGIQLDLGGYAKGYALESIRKILVNHSITQALINFGNSSVLALGSHPHGDSWSIGINDPYTPDKIVGNISLRDNTLSTSGNMPSHTGHIFNPFTGQYNADRRIVSVSAPNAIDAEVVSTTLMIADKIKEKEIVSQFTIDQYCIFSL